MSIYTPAQVVGVQQIDINTILNLMLTMMIVVMLVTVMGKAFKNISL